MNADFNNQNTDTKILKGDVLYIAGFSRYAVNLNDNININFNDNNISFWDFYFIFTKKDLITGQM